MHVLYIFSLVYENMPEGVTVRTTSECIKDFFSIFLFSSLLFIWNVGRPWLFVIIFICRILAFLPKFSFSFLFSVDTPFFFFAVAKLCQLQFVYRKTDLIDINAKRSKRILVVEETKRKKTYHKTRLFGTTNLSLAEKKHFYSTPSSEEIENCTVGTIY